MKILITGGTGLIGSALAADLAASGHEVIVLTRNPSKSEKIPAGARAVAWDGKSANGWGEFAEAADAIVNLAGESIGSSNLLKIRWSAERKKKILSSRENVGNAIVEAVKLAQRKPAMVFQMSGVNYYGTLNDKPIDETAPAGDDYLSEVCKQWEASTQPVESYGVRRVVARTGVVLSTKGGTLPLQMIPFRLFVGGPIGSGQQALSWIHIDDVIKAIRFFIENPESSGVYNLTSPDLVNNAQFSKVLGKVMSRPSFFPIPGIFFKIAFGEASKLLLEGQKPVPKRLQEAGFVFQFGDLEAALRNLLHK